MKKVLVALLVVLIVVTSAIFLVSCKDKGTTQAPTYNIIENPDIPADFKIGVIHIGDPADGSGYSYTHDQGIVGMQISLGVTDAHIIRKLNVADNDSAAIKTAIEDCIQQGASIVFGTSYGYMDTMAAMAEEEAYKNVIFSHASGYKSNDKNMNNYFGKIYQARYLAGIAAGLKTTSNKIGYVAAYGTELAETCSGINAFALGAKAANAEAKVYVKTLNSWYDPDGETKAAEALLDLGCDIITQHSDTPNPQIAAQKAGKFGCGYNSDMTKDAPAAHLVSAVWNWEVYYTTAVKAALQGREYFMANVGIYFGGLEEGFVDVSTPSINCAAGTKSAINYIRAKMINGEFDVFEGKEYHIAIKDGQIDKVNTKLVDAALGALVIDAENAEKNVTVSAGDPYVGDVVIKGSMNQFVANVELK